MPSFSSIVYFGYGCSAAFSAVVGTCFSISMAASLFCKLIATFCTPGTCDNNCCTLAWQPVHVMPLTEYVCVIGFNYDTKLDMPPAVAVIQSWKRFTSFCGYTWSKDLRCSGPIFLKYDGVRPVTFLNCAERCATLL